MFRWCGRQATAHKYSMQTSKIYFLPFFLLVFFLAGCEVGRALMPDVGFPVSSKEYNCFVGKKYIVVSPLVIKKFTGSIGNYWLTPPDGLKEGIIFIANVPIGSIIIADHVTKSGGYWFRNTTESFIGKFEDPSVFNGGFELSSVIKYNYKLDTYQEPFCKRFLGMKEAYLKEVR